VVQKKPTIGAKTASSISQASEAYSHSNFNGQFLASASGPRDQGNIQIQLQLKGCPTNSLTVVKASKNAQLQPSNTLVKCTHIANNICWTWLVS